MAAEIRPHPVDWRHIGRTFLRRFMWSVIFTCVSTLVFLFLGVPNVWAKPIAFGLSMTIVFAGVWPRMTPDYRLKNAITWGAHFLCFAGGWALMTWWWGE